MTVNRAFALLVIGILSPASARAITISTVPIGNPGNSRDIRFQFDSVHPNLGAVANRFRMGKTEVTNAQYVEFLNAVAKTDAYGLYSPEISTRGGIIRSGNSGNYAYAVKAPALGGAYPYDDKPVVFVSSGDAMRFANWLHNRQPTGAQDASTTEDGAYTLNGAVTNAALEAVTRNAGARWWLPSEDEWYKAAFHKNDGVTGNYWDYATGTNSAPNNNLPSADTGNSANFFQGSLTTGDTDFPMTDAGAYTLSKSAYGTDDQVGNVSEWVETLLGGTYRGVRYGGWNLGLADFEEWVSFESTAEAPTVGFRVASIPEPAAMYLGTLAAVFVWSRRHKH